MVQEKPTITWDDFDKVAMRVGRIVRVEPFPEARKPAYKLWIDFGPYGIKKSSAQLPKWYPDPDALVGRLIVAVTNFPPKQIGPFMSEVLVLGAIQSDGRVVLLQPDGESELGAPIA
ncbi:MAG: tRNA-binding protein [Chloroflexi bacterium]|nr:tRNA-binding protein [Chloroflexota bacterium]